MNNKVLRTFNTACEWIYRIVVVNVLWLIFTIIGLGVASFFPATFALFAVVKQWLDGNKEASTFTLFFDAFKKGYWRAQSLGYSMLFIGIILYTNINFLLSYDSIFIKMILIVTVSVALLFVCTGLYIMPLAVYVKHSPLKLMKFAGMISIVHPFSTFCLFIGIVLLLIAFVFMPLAAFFFSGGVISLYSSVIVANVVRRLEMKRSLQNNLI